MSRITWQTPAGLVGLISENDFFEKPLVAVDSGLATVYYDLVSGSLPAGMSILREGKISGVPVISKIGVPESGITFEFAVRASTAAGSIADRSFSLTVSNLVSPVLLPLVLPKTEIFDGDYYSVAFYAEDTAVAQLTFSLASGQLPPGLTLSSGGLLSGYPLLPIGQGLDALSGFEAIRYDTVGYDRLPRRADKNYSFSIQVSDGIKSNIRQYSLLLRRKDRYTADNSNIQSDDNRLSVSYDNKYLPEVTTPEGIIAIVRQNEEFAFKFNGYHPADREVIFELNGDFSVTFDEDFFGFDTAKFDQTARGVFPGVTLNSDSGWLYGQVPSQPEARQIYTFTVNALVKDDRSLVSKAKTFSIEVLGDLYNYITWETDSNLGTIAEGKPCSLKISAVTSRGIPVLYSLETSPELLIILGDTNGIKIGMTISGAGLGSGIKVLDIKSDGKTIVVSEFLGFLEAGIYLTFSLAASSVTKVFIEAVSNRKTLPQGVQLSSDGYLIGRPSFRRFSVDSYNSKVSVYNTTGIEVGMTVTGPSATTGCKVLQIINSTTLLIGPAIVASAGSYLTFSSNNVEITRVVTESATTTRIDDGSLTTYDSLKEFTIRATAIDGSVSDVRLFRVTLENYNLAPYENLYLKALPSNSQREKFLEVFNNQDIFPDNYIYRINDPWFGKQQDIKALLLPGISPSSLSKYAAAMTHNHYNKTIKFGPLKTAVVVDSSFNPVYEVLFMELEDTQVGSKTISKEQINLTALYSHFNPYLENGSSYSTIYPNSFQNMRNVVGGALTFENRGALPDWMTSPQDGNGRAVDQYKVIGFVPAAVLCYTLPGKSNIIKYRLEQTGFNFNEIEFIADRYQLDNGLSRFFNTSTNQFKTSTETTFDFITRAGFVDANVNYALTIPFSEIHGRTVDYINTKFNGIDYQIDYSDGDTLIFAQQEKYAGYSLSYDGWYKYTDEYSEAGFDSVGIDSLEIIPGYYNQSPRLEQVVAYTQVGLRVTLDFANHGLKNGAIVDTVVTSGTASNTTAPITVIDVNQIYYNAPNSQNTSGLMLVTLTGSKLASYSQLQTKYVYVTLNKHGYKVGQKLTVVKPGMDPFYITVAYVPQNDPNTFAYISNAIKSESGTFTVTEINERGGVWQISIANNIVSLNFIQEMQPGQKVRVSKGQSHGGSILTYDTAVKSGNTVPEYTPTNQKNNASKEKTTFDGNGTRFIDYRDQFARPEINDKYLKFPQIGVFT